VEARLSEALQKRYGAVVARVQSELEQLRNAIVAVAALGVVVSVFTIGESGAKAVWDSRMS
jgi:hypothetical protein